jgi:regulator of nucleoside diphosphate kinase
MPHNPCLLTTKDYTILEVMLERCLGLDDPLRPILQEKLKSAVVVFADDIPSAVVTLNSRVSYSVNGGPAETRIVAHDGIGGLVGRVISITVPRGLALLGVAEGQSFRFRDGGRDGVGETVTVREVAYQPEAARREAETMNHPAVPPFPGLRLVHSSADAPAAARKTATRYNPAPDDPGPSAA